MTFEELEKYIMQNANVTYDYPFDEKVRVYRISEKIFALTEDTSPLRVNLKCNPIYALELRSLYEDVSSGYHMNKKHWNTVSIDESSDVDEETIKELLDHSFELVYASLTKKQKALLLL